MKDKNQAKWKQYRRDEAIFEANEILKAKAPDVPLVSNVGRAGLVLGLNGARRHPDYRSWEDRRWAIIRDGSSCTIDDVLPFTIIATEDQAFEIRKTRTQVDLVEVLEAADRLWLGDPKARVQMTKAGDPVFIDGVQCPSITRTQHDVIYTLLCAGRRMTAKELGEKCYHGDPIGTLNRLRKLPYWSKVLIFPGRTHGGGYGIR